MSIISHVGLYPACNCGKSTWVRIKHPAHPVSSATTFLCVECGTTALRHDALGHTAFVYRKPDYDREASRYMDESLEAIIWDFVHRRNHAWFLWRKAENDAIRQELGMVLLTKAYDWSAAYEEFEIPDDKREVYLARVKALNEFIRTKAPPGFDDVIRLAKLPVGLAAFMGEEPPHRLPEGFERHHWTPVSHEEMAAFDIPLHPDHLKVTGFMQVVQERLKAAGVDLEFKQIENQLEWERTYRSPWFEILLGTKQKEPIVACVGRRNWCWSVKIGCNTLFDHTNLQHIAGKENLFIHSINDSTSQTQSIRRYNVEIRLWEQEGYFTDEKAAKMADYILCASKLAD